MSKVDWVPIRLAWCFFVGGCFFWDFAGPRASRTSSPRFHLSVCHGGGTELFSLRQIADVPVADAFARRSHFLGFSCLDPGLPSWREARSQSTELCRSSAKWYLHWQLARWGSCLLSCPWFFGSTLPSSCAVCSYLSCQRRLRRCCDDCSVSLASLLSSLASWSFIRPAVGSCLQANC